LKDHRFLAFKESVGPRGSTEYALDEYHRLVSYEANHLGAGFKATLSYEDGQLEKVIVNANGDGVQSFAIKSNRDAEASIVKGDELKSQIVYYF
jgi:hypothetical protein